MTHPEMRDAILQAAFYASAELLNFFQRNFLLHSANLADLHAMINQAACKIHAKHEILLPFWRLDRRLPSQNFGTRTGMGLKLPKSALFGGP